MVDGHTLFDYNVAPNEVILILIKKNSLDHQQEDTSETTKNDEANAMKSERNDIEEEVSERVC